jgi:tetratricopeptide (TPR) repeat protein
MLTVRLWNEQSKTQSALSTAQEKEREARAGQALAEANFRKALWGVDQLLRAMETPAWNSSAATAALRREVARRAIHIFQDFIDEPGADPAVQFQAARAYEMLTNIHLVAREFDPARQYHRRAADLLQGLTAAFPENPEYALTRGRLHGSMANWEHSLGQQDASLAEYRQAIDGLRRALPYDRDGQVHDRLAFLLSDCQEPALRNPGESVLLASRAIELAPHQAAFWTTLALARYRGAAWNDAREALEKAETFAGPGAFHWLLRSLIEWRMDERGQARDYYRKAADWLERNPMNDEVCHLRMEASTLLGIRWP